MPRARHSTFDVTYDWFHEDLLLLRSWSALSICDSTAPIAQRRLYGACRVVLALTETALVWSIRPSLQDLKCPLAIHCPLKGHVLAHELVAWASKLCKVRHEALMVVGESQIGPTAPQVHSHLILQGHSPVPPMPVPPDQLVQLLKVVWHCPLQHVNCPGHLCQLMPCSHWPVISACIAPPPDMGGHAAGQGQGDHATAEAAGMAARANKGLLRWWRCLASLLTCRRASTACQKTKCSTITTTSSR